MTNKLRYFIANWKMYGHLNNVKSLNKVIKFKKKNKNAKNIKIIYCPPFTLLHAFVQKFKNTELKTGAQNCNFASSYGPPTGSINAKMIKSLKCEYVILGHSEKRSKGENDSIINKKIISALNNNLRVIFCIGETYSQKKKKLTKRTLLNQLIKGLKNVKNKKNIIIAYEPVWSIGSGLIPKSKDLVFVTSEPVIIYSLISAAFSVERKNKLINIFARYLIFSLYKNFYAILISCTLSQMLKIANSISI